MDPIILGFLLINGVLIGGVYGGIALGLSLIFGVLRVINFAHGSLLTLSMYLAYALSTLGIHPYLAAPITMPALFLVGYGIQRFVISPLFKRERALVVEPLSALLLTAGLFLIIDNLILMIFGPDVRSVPTEIAYQSIFVGDFPINLARLIACIAAVAVAAGLSQWLKRSDTGRQIRAVAQNREAASLSGIDVPRIYAITFGVGCAVLGLFGALLLPFFSLTPSVGISFGIKSFLVVVLGGIGSITGSLVGGLVLGVFESVASQFVTATSATIFSFALFILILLVRPVGLMGKA